MINRVDVDDDENDSNFNFFLILSFNQKIESTNEKLRKSIYSIRK